MSILGMGPNAIEGAMRARIAELEDRTEQECIDDTFTAIRMKLDKAEAELAALKAQRCETCRMHTKLCHGGIFHAYTSIGSFSCPMFGKPFEPDFSCSLWMEP